MSEELLISSLMIRDYPRNLQLRTSCYVSQFLGDNLGLKQNGASFVHLNCSNKFNVVIFVSVHCSRCFFTTTGAGMSGTSDGTSSSDSDRDSSILICAAHLLLLSLLWTPANKSKTLTAKSTIEIGLG